MHKSNNLQSCTKTGKDIEISQKHQKFIYKLYDNVYNIHILGKVSCNNLKIKMCNIILQENTLFLNIEQQINTKNVRRNIKLQI